MSVKYSLVAMQNPQKKSEPKKFYAKSQSAGALHIEEICTSVAHSGSIIRGDVLAVTDGLIFEMMRGLASGKIVDLGDFGHFQMQVSSKGAATEKEFTAANIKKAKIQFRPGKLLTNMIATLEYNQVPKLPKKVKKADEKKSIEQ